MDNMETHFFILRGYTVEIEYNISEYCFLTELFLVKVLHPVTRVTHGWVLDLVWLHTKGICDGDRDSLQWEPDGVITAVFVT